MRAAAALLALTLAGCAVSSAPGSGHVARADRLAADGDLDGALRAYDAALAEGVTGDAALRARAGRATVTAAQAAAAELGQVRSEMAKLVEQIAARDGEVAKLTRELNARAGEVANLTRELNARAGELARARQDLTARQAEVTRLGSEAEQLRADLEDLKRLEMRLERRSK